MVSEIECAWAAGFFDGEGSVSFAKVAGKHRYLLVSVSCNARSGLERLHRWWGGRLYFENSRRCNRWILRSRQAEAFLRDIRPHISLKGEVIDVAMEYQKTVGYRGCRVISEEDRATRIRLHAELLAINARD